MSPSSTSNATELSGMECLQGLRVLWTPPKGWVSLGISVCRKNLWKTMLECQVVKRLCYRVVELRTTKQLSLPLSPATFFWVSFPSVPLAASLLEYWHWRKFLRAFRGILLSNIGHSTIHKGIHFARAGLFFQGLSFVPADAPLPKSFSTDPAQQKLILQAFSQAF